ncbi:MAG: DUF4172 domain-containing protein [Alphaproteobacteria bacterium]|nr:DUF4172 domain-containing protein [Alphaproteobacteria bacterium]
MNIYDPDAPYYRPRYNWQFANWPNFVWDSRKLAGKLAKANQLRQQFSEQFSAFKAEIGWQEHYEASFTHEILETSKIEGVRLDADNIRSSVAQHFQPTLKQKQKQKNRPTDEHNLLVKIITDACENYQRNLSKEILFDWHNWLFPTGTSGYLVIRVGDWRLEDIDVIDIKKNMPDYVAPPPDIVPNEMERFINWCNGKYFLDQKIPNINDLDPIIQSGLAHFWFETIHPFQDGNGRIGRNLALFLLNRAYQDSQPFHMLSKHISHHQRKYYENLNKASKSDGDITDWLLYYCEIFILAINEAILKYDKLVFKSNFWYAYGHLEIDAKLKKSLNTYFDSDKNKTDFSTKEWQSIGNYSSNDAALNAINFMIKNGLAKPSAGGRSARYELILNKA